VELIDVAAAQTAGFDAQQAFLRPDQGNFEFLHLQSPISTLHHGLSLQVTPVPFMVWNLIEVMTMRLPR
jgi:hypothetical protein